ncbi:MAG: DUF4345 domain-containing protein [Trueperaceae bacterium]
MTPRTQFGYLAALLTLILGLVALLGPIWMAELLGFNATRLQPRGLSEIRATYGAMFTVMGAVMLWAIPMRPRGVPYVRFAAFLWFGAGVGRLLSMIIDGVITPMNFAALALEVVIGLGALLCSLERPKVTPVQSTPIETTPEEIPDPLKAYRE